MLSMKLPPVFLNTWVVDASLRILTQIPIPKYVACAWKTFSWKTFSWKTFSQILIVRPPSSNLNFQITAHKGLEFFLTMVIFSRQTTQMSRFGQTQIWAVKPGKFLSPWSDELFCLEDDPTPLLVFSIGNTFFQSCTY